jgi:hypothetical protein
MRRRMTSLVESIFETRRLLREMTIQVNEIPSYRDL